MPFQKGRVAQAYQPEIGLPGGPGEVRRAEAVPFQQLLNSQDLPANLLGQLGNAGLAARVGRQARICALNSAAGVLDPGNPKGPAGLFRTLVGWFGGIGRGCFWGHGAAGVRCLRFRNSYRSNRSCPPDRWGQVPVGCQPFRRGTGPAILAQVDPSAGAQGPGSLRPPAGRAAWPGERPS